MDSRAIGDIFREVTSVTEEQLKEAQAIQEKTGEPLGVILVRMGAITEKEKVKALGKQWGIPFVDLEEVELDEDLINTFPPRIMRQYRVIPLKLTDNRLTLAMANPVDIFTIDEIQIMTGYKIEPVIASEEDIETALRRLGSAHERITEDIKRILDGAEETIVQTIEDEEELDPTEAASLAEQGPIVQLVDKILSSAVSEGASDIHVQPEPDEVRIRYRVDGVLHDSMTLPKRLHPPIIARIKVMAEMDITEKRRPQDGRISLSIDGRPFDFRVSTLPGVNGEKAVLRILDKSSITLGLENLGFSPETLEKFNELISRSWGIILVTGPTGSGKSTTLYSALHRLNTPEKNIITVEDPVEYQVAGLTQAHVNVKAGLTFAEVLRSMLRQDPDIIMVGEIRDRETAVIATEAALTGHLVLSTLHTNTAPGAIARLVEMKIEPFLLASSIIGVQAQRLVRRICPKCKEPFTPPEKSLRRLNFPEDELANAQFMRGAGCEYCRGTGYKGRIGVYELMIITDEIREAILREEPEHEIARIAREQGMQTLAEDGMRKVMAGITTPEELLRVITAE